MKRLKVPGVINQFTQTLTANKAQALFKLLSKYKPETKAEKKTRLVEEASAKKEGKTVEKSKPVVTKFGLNHVVQLVEQNKAKLVVIAHDVDPIELVMFLPHLCKNKNIPFCIVKGKARLGQMVHQKQATCLALTEVRNEDKSELERLSTAFKAQYNDNASLTKRGEIELGHKAQ